MSVPKIENRSLQIRAAAGDEFALVGRALSYNEISSNELYSGMRERILPGAFKESLASGKDVKALLNHDSKGLPLGRLANSTLKIVDSAEGLDIRVQLDKDNSQHRDVYASVKRGDISEMSFAFVAKVEGLSEGVFNGQKCQVRDVVKAELFDVSVVVSPFYGDGATAVAARAAAANNAKTPQQRLQEIDGDYERQQRAHKITLQLLDEKAKGRRAANDVQQDPDEPLSDAEFESLRAAIAGHFGKAQHGLTPKYFVASADSKAATAYNMDSAALDCMKIRYASDAGNYVFGDPEPSDDDADDDARSRARALQSQVQLRARMEAAAGRR